MTADKDEDFRRESAYLPGGFQDPVVFQGVKTGNADQAGPAAAKPGGRSPPETEIGDGDRMATGSESGTDIFEAKRLDKIGRASCRERV